MTEPSLREMQTDGSRPDALSKARSARSAKAPADSTGKSIQEAISALDSSRRASVRQRLLAMPESARGSYFGAECSRASPRQTIKAFCMGRVCWEQAGRCTSLACPLYAYHPQQKERVQDATAA